MNHRSNILKITAGILVILLIAAAGCTTAPSDDGLTITNSDGTLVYLPGTAERIVLLNSNAGEILYLLGEADRVVGISQSIQNNAEQRTMYPSAEVVGTWNEPDVERLIALDVDLVLGYATSKPKNAEVLKASGIPIVYIDCTKPSTMVSDILEVGKLVGKTQRANDIAGFYTSVMEKVSAAGMPYDVQYRIYAESYTAFYGQGKGTGIGEMIDLTAGCNILASVDGARKISDEWVVSEKPEIILKVVNSMDAREDVLKELQARTGFSTTPAVQNHKVWLIRNDLTYGPRACAGAVALLQMQYPGALPGISAESVLEEFNARFSTSFDTTLAVYPEIGGSAASSA